MAYQHTPTASKRNAFCWLSWEPQIDWKATSNATSARQTQVVEAKRAEGVDLAFLSGLGSSSKRQRWMPAHCAARKPSGVRHG